MKVHLKKREKSKDISKTDIKKELALIKRKSRIPQKIKNMIYQYIFNDISNGNAAGKRPYHYAKELGIAPQTAKVYLDYVINNHIELPNFTQLIASMSAYYEKVMRDFNEQYKKTTDIKEKIMLNNEIIKTFSAFTDMLENFGIKEKIPHMLAYKELTEKETKKEKNIIILTGKVDIEEFERKQREELQRLHSNSI